ncbi:MAG: right-handed parallel beta-helix repeat-containing protein [Cryomorphaceae bacterium]|nr:right-handed parallel beta-helix repeat-containing protein [Cryomorphaceae bacterium]
MSISSFKKCLLTLLISTPFGTSLLVRAQTPPTQYATIGFERNTGVLYFPVYRLNANSTERFNRGATTYTETELQQAGIFPGHRITKIAFEKESGGTLGSNPLVLKVWMQTIPTSGPSGLTNIFDQDILSANQVFLDSNTIILDSASWFEIDLDTAFIYSGGNLRIYTENIILGASPFSTGPISWYFSGNWNVSSGRNNISYPFPSGQVLSGSNTIGYRPNTRIGFESPIGSDISLKQFLSPTSICAGFTDVEVEIQNTGITDLDSIMISWQVNSVFQSQISYQPVLPSGGTVSISLGNFIANHDSIYEITAFLANADSIGDAFSANDTIRITYQPALFGGYTINSAVPTGGNNFQSFNEASAALSQRGVCGPVAMIVALNSGPYNERVIFGEIFGVDSINRITIIGNNNALIHNSFNPAMELNGADYLTIINLTIIMNGLNSAAVYLSNRSDYNTFENCSISFSGTATNSASVLLGGGILPGIGGQAGDYNSFKNCVIDGGGFAAALYGANTNNRSIGNSFINCEIKNFVGTGIHISNQEDFQIKNCKIHRTGAPPLDNVRGITLDGDIRGTTIEKSEVYDLLSGGGPSITYGIYCIGSGSLDKPILIKNNLLYNFNSNGLIQAISVRQNANHLNLHHNTVVVDNMNHTGNSMVVGIFCDNLITHFQVLNNIIFVQSSSTGQKTLLRITANAPNIISNGNAFHLGVTGIVGQSGSGMFNTLAGWQTSTNRDLNSVQADPLFVSLTLKNFTPSSPLVNDIGDSIGIAEDFFSNLRDLSAPDPGAIEFSPFSRDLRLSNVVLHPDPCLLGNDTIFVEIENIIGPTIPLNTEPITVHWLIQGPNTSTGSVVFNSGNLPINTKTNKISTTINLSTPGTYEIIVFLDTNQVNQNPYNDTILLSSFVVEPIFWIEPKSDSLFDDTTTVRLQAFSPNFAVGKVIITEITQNRVGSSAPITGWPSYIKANQYVELFGPANEDISGYTLE